MIVQGYPCRVYSSLLHADNIMGCRTDGANTALTEQAAVLPLWVVVAACSA
jgi:hypothetical protein